MTKPKARVGDELSELQIEALRLASMGYTAKRAGQALGGRSEAAVLRLWQECRRKMGALTTTEAARIAERDGYMYVAPFEGPRKRGDWQREWQRGHEFVEHFQGIAWHDAPVPVEGHKCIPQTRGVVRVSGLPLMPISRCACGAVKVREAWEDCNSRSDPCRVAESPA